MFVSGRNTGPSIFCLARALSGNFFIFIPNDACVEMLKATPKLLKYFFVIS